MNSVYKKVSPGLYIGNAVAASDVQFLSEENITFAINLTGEQSPLVEDMITYDYSLPNNELLESEYFRVITKLRKISNDIDNARSRGANILIYETNCKNKAPLVAGYHLTLAGNNPNTVIKQLETIFYTNNQREEAAEYNKRLASGDMNMSTDEYTDALKKKNQRESIRCLTLVTFRKIIGRA